jgi:hypothetical protein
MMEYYGAYLEFFIEQIQICFIHLKSWNQAFI